ncbi:putative bifunctional diguanylate cyclase/phosphodiesterase [Sphingomicrobium lutaoense]|uniref:Diguanylate cyclase (GGDEF)-like protein n=1 Tax=Sphingomicrobium lutaoense TaxID=515949 RepID=A0A839Z089_9SPHN|nr:EAL domain-containing protein [Sphingomicrobium lutaoense]MBB3762985.1 diguanylate cyclase (GGDEF)-like protein [Sphingomicrobium lutaoense]
MILMFPACTSTAERRALIRETFASLRQQVPLLYAIALTTLIGLQAITGEFFSGLLSPINLFSAALIWRLCYWLWGPSRNLTTSQQQRELQTTAFFTALFSLSFSVWIQHLITTSPELVLAVVLYGTLAAIGCAYGLSSFPAAASIPPIVLGLPIGARLMWMPDLFMKGIGLSLFLVVLLMIRLLQVHNRAISQLVSTKIAKQRELRRAVSAERAARELAETDALTSLSNRRALVGRIEKELQDDSVFERKLLLAIIDLDGFKSINDAFGHAAGDAVLKTVAHRLHKHFEGVAMVARMGGDEFALLVDPTAKGSNESASQVGAEICRVTGSSLDWEGKILPVAAACGITVFDCTSSSASELLRNADIALYRAKSQGRGRYHVFDAAMMRREMRRNTIEQLLGSDAPIDQLGLHFQPIVSIGENSPVAYEALARWYNATLGTIEPKEFIHLAEQKRVIGRINEAVLYRACQAANKWQTDVRLSYNLSAVQLCQPGAAKRLLRIIEDCECDARRVQFEVTETALLSDFDVARQELQELRDAECLLALDDFGAGNASIKYLREMKFDLVKLDGSLIKNVVQSDHCRSLLSGVIELCRAMGVKCCAEHVENADQLAILRELGCDQAQGFFVDDLVSEKGVTCRDAA